jgi:hypothetical protein
LTIDIWTIPNGFKEWSGLAGFFLALGIALHRFLTSSFLPDYHLNLSLLHYIHYNFYVNYIKQWKLKEGDKLDWSWEVKNGDMVVVVVKRVGTNNNNNKK